MSERVSDTERDRCGYTTADIVKNHGNPVWEAIWGVIRKWDMDASGTDAQCIFDAVTAALAARPASAEPVACYGIVDEETGRIVGVGREPKPASQRPGYLPSID